MTNDCVKLFERCEIEQSFEEFEDWEQTLLLSMRSMGHVEIFQIENKWLVKSFIPTDVERI
jgi:hypothetical protein